MAALREVMGLQIGDGTAHVVKLIVVREQVGRVAVQYAAEFIRYGHSAPRRLEASELPVVAACQGLDGSLAQGLALEEEVAGRGLLDEDVGEGLSAVPGTPGAEVQAVAS